MGVFDCWCGFLPDSYCSWFWAVVRDMVNTSAVRKRFKYFFFVFTYVSCASIAFAEQTAERAVSKVFASNCFMNIPLYERLEGVARAHDWADLPPRLHPLVAPQDPDASWRGWVLSKGSDIFLLAYSKGIVDDKPYQTCAVVVKAANVSLLRAELEQRLPIEKVFEGSQAYQTTHGYSVDVPENGRTIMTILHIEGKKDSPVTIGLMSMKN